ncbi:anti-sigma factor domain-containing protein [Filobacillus milosensis]
MRKGIIVEHKKRHTLMMTSDGSFYKTRIYWGRDIF